MTIQRISPKTGKPFQHAQIVDLTTNEYAIREEGVPREPERPEKMVHELEDSIEPKKLFRKALHGPFKAIDLSKPPSKKGLIQGLTLQIPLNELDLPLYIYRPDMLDEAYIYDVLTRYTDGEEKRDQGVGELTEASGMLDAAGITLTYGDGYPVLPNGKPFWEQFDFETADAYDMFMSYLQLDGLRKLSELTSYPMHFLQEFYHTHYWVARARAFDLFRVANSQRQRLNRLLSTEDKHYKLAEKVLEKLGKYFEGLDADDLADELTPDKAVAMLEKLVGVQRISIGLTKGGESKEKEGLRTVEHTAALVHQATGVSTTAKDAVDESFEDLLDDPESIALAQDLILKRQASGNME